MSTKTAGVDASIEKYLNERFVKWEFEAQVPLAAFDESKSLHNQARFQPINSDTVSRYAEAMERGEVFPPVLAYRQSNGKLVLMDGNHRFQGKKTSEGMNVGRLDVYVIEASPETIQLITFEANTRHGMPPSNEERLRHAIWLVDNGNTQEAAAAVTGLPKSAVSSAWQLEKAERRARQHQVTKGWDKLSNDAKLRLATIYTDPGFVEATRFATDAKLTTPEIKSLTTELKTLKSDEAQLKLIEESREAYRRALVEKGGTVVNRRGMDARRSIIPHLGYLVSADYDAILNAVLTPAHRDDLLDRIGGAVTQIETLRSRLEGWGSNGSEAE